MMVDDAERLYYPYPVSVVTAHDALYRLTAHDRSSNPSREILLVVRARIPDVPHASVILVLPMALQRVHPAEVLVTSSDHHVAVERPRVLGSADLVCVGLLDGHPTAYPLRLPRIAEMRTDMAFHVWGPLVLLEVSAVRASVRVRARLAPAAARRRCLVEDRSIESRMMSSPK